MADYTAPFRLPKFSDSKFEEEKASYVAKHGYTITVPGFQDIIHLPTYKPMTAEEKSLYYSKEQHKIPEKRRLELRAMKAKKKEQFERMLASPTPKLARSFASVMAATDNAQDAIITLAAIGRIACKILPRFLARFLAGPVGWLWLLAECMNFLMMPTACMLNPRACKRSMKGKLKNVPGNLRAKMKAYPSSGRIIPSFSEAIQMLQVTDNIYGWGVSIGPIFGLASDLVSGGVRWAMGEKVSFRNAPTNVEIYQKEKDKLHNYARWERPKTKMTKWEFNDWKTRKQMAGTWTPRTVQSDLIAEATKMHTTFGGLLIRTDWTNETCMYALNEIVQSGVQNVLDEWNPLVNVDGLEFIEIEAPIVTDPLTEEIFLEAGMDPDNYVAWPSLGERWATYEQISASTAPIAAANFKYFNENCPNFAFKHIAGQSGVNGGLLAISNLQGEKALSLEYHATLTITEMLLDHGYSFPRAISEQQIYAFGFWTAAHQQNGTRPTLKETLGYAKNSLGFEFTTNPGALPG